MSRSDYLKLLALLMLTGVIDHELADGLANSEVICISLDSAVQWLVEELGLQVNPQPSNALVPSDGPSRQGVPQPDGLEGGPPLWLLLAYQHYWTVLKDQETT